MRGRPSGVNELPLNIPVEIELVVDISFESGK